MSGVARPSTTRRVRATELRTIGEGTVGWRGGEVRCPIVMDARGRPYYQLPDGSLRRRDRMRLAGTEKR